LSQALTLKDNGTFSEPPMIKALRKDRYDIFEILLGLPHRFLTYEVLCLIDEQGRNILHHAVIKSHSEFVKKLVYLDSDFGKLRGQKDSKGKTPQTYDDKGNFKEVFETVWDATKSGNIERMNQLVAKGLVDDQTAWSKNTPLHIAVKYCQI
jgi:ankyrin repeat protein